MKIRTRWPQRLALFLPLSLTGCFHPHIINDQDASYCEAQGHPRGTDANADCAAQREADRIASGLPAVEDRPPPPPVTPAPPHRPGGVSQTTPTHVASGATATVSFFVSVTPDCNADGLPTVRIDKQPAHGTVRVTPLTDYARTALNSDSVVCGDKKIAGIAVDYTANRDYVGADSLEFEMTTKAGGATAFKAPIRITRPPRSDD